MANMITPERLEELDRDWNDSAKWSDEEYYEWYSELTQEEQAQIDAWDKRYSKGVLKLCEAILKKSEK